jgi:hypothetical protein
MKFKQGTLAFISVLFSCMFLYLLNRTTAPMQDGSTVVQAAADAVNIRFILTAALDVHTVLLLFFFGGCSFDIVEEFKQSDSGKIAIAIILAAWVIASSGVLHK